jgi:acetyl-CoA synthetase
MSATSEFAWIPEPEQVERAQLTRFLRRCHLPGFQPLLDRAAADPAWFTEEVLKFLDIKFDPPYREVLNTARGPEWPVWCEGGGLNISTMCVDRHASSRPNHVALTWESEDGQRRTMTYAELLGEVQRCTAYLRRHELRKGEAIGLHLPMLPETVVLLLAAARAGLIAVPLFSGYGPGAIESRMKDVKARLLVTVESFVRRGKTVAAGAVAMEAAERCPDLESVLMLDGGASPWSAECFDSFRDHEGAPEPTLAEDPLIILYTSGTTGRPKGILHTHCGFPIKSAQDMAFGTDVGPEDRISWVTDLGWMMGPWLIYGATILGATLAIYDGAPDYPAPDRLWSFCSSHKVSVLGISPSLVRALAAAGDEHATRHSMPDLRILASTGEPWNPEPWWWLFRTIGRSRIPIINYSGGTEISGGILSNNPLLPIRPCKFSAPCPGIVADVLDEEGHSVRGAVGELVIRGPWIGMARGFWKDPDRYLDTYWSRFPGVWAHGDWARIDAGGQWEITGRSDDTIKIAGKRVGPAEVESLLTGHPSVVEAAVIAVPDEQKGNSMVAFCVLKEDRGATEGNGAVRSVQLELQARVAQELGKPLQPKAVHVVGALPKTRNAKVMRRVLRAAYLNQDAGDLTALENPAALEAIARAGREGESK